MHGDSGEYHSSTLALKGLALLSINPDLMYTIILLALLIIKDS